MTTNNQNSLDEIREQLEEFALHLKPGTTNGKHRTAIFDTLELAKLVQALMQQQEAAINKTIMEARIDELASLYVDFDDRKLRHIEGTRLVSIEDRIAELQLLAKKYGRADNEHRS